MNFTALVILLEIDNILAALFQKKIDIYGVADQMKYNKETIAIHFERTARFITQRQGLFWIQRRLEVFIFSVLMITLYIVFTVIPVAMVSLYILIPPKETVIDTGV